MYHMFNWTPGKTRVFFYIKMMENKKLIKTGIQGGPGSFHEIAAIFEFGADNICTIGYNTFGELVKASEINKTDIGLIAIENTVAGSLMSNYALLEEAKIEVIGEILLRIEQNLLALHGQTMEDIREIHSHPIALMQCQQFLSDFPHIKLVETEDTALSAAKISERKILNAGAIASQRAAELYGLHVIKTGIETNKRNFTRFLIIRGRNEQKKTNGSIPDKASISFTLPHSTGSLAKVLSVFMFYNINLTKIQSIPVIGKEWEYHFIVDLVFDDYEQYKQSLVAVRPLTTGMQVFGEYRRARKYFLSNKLVNGSEVNTFEKV